MLTLYRYTKQIVILMEVSETMKAMIAELHTQSINKRNTDTNHINVRFPLDLIKQIDDATDRFKVTRSDIIKNAVTNYLQILKNNL